MPSVNSSPNASNPNKGGPNKKNQVIVSAADTRVFSDAITRRLQLFRAVNTSLAMTDSATRRLNFARGIFQALIFTEQMQRLVSLERAFNDTSAFNEHFVTVNGRNITDTLSFSDSIARAVSLGRGASDDQIFAEGLSNPPQGLVRIVLDSEAYSDFTTFNLYPAPRAAQDDFSFSEDPDPLVIVMRLVADTLPTTETMISFTQAARDLIDNFLLDELPIKVSALTQELLDDFSFSEQLVSNVLVQPPNTTAVQFADAVGIPNDPATVAVDLLRLQTEQTAYSDFVTANVVLLAKEITDSFSFSDSVVGFIGGLPHGVIGKGITNFIQGGGTVKVIASGGSIILRKGSGKVTKIGGSGSSTPTSGSGEIN